jgi:hypothetical protein
MISDPPVGNSTRALNRSRISDSMVEVLLDLVVELLRVHVQRVDLGAEQVADDAPGEAGFPLEQRRRAADEGLLSVDLAPELQEGLDLAAEVLLGHALRYGPNDDAAGILRQQLGDHLPELGPLLPALDLPAHPHLGSVGHVDQESAGEGDLGGDPAALGADGLLGHLHREGLSLLEDVLDVGQRAARRDLALPRFSAVPLTAVSVASPAPPPVAPATPVGTPFSGSLLHHDALGGRVRGVGVQLCLALPLAFFLRLFVLVRLQQIGCVEERALLLPDVDEGGLDSREHRLDPTEIDVTDGAAVVGAVYQELDQSVVFQDGHAGFPLAPVDQDFTLQAFLPRQGWRRKTNAPPGASFVEVRRYLGPRGLGYWRGRA